MKTIFYTFLLCIPHICLSTPSWLPINPDYKHHFVLSDSIDQFLNTNLKDASTIRVLSSTEVSQGQVYQLNTIFNESTLYYRQPQFLQREMVIRDNGDVHFRNPGSILLRTNTVIGQSWLMDTLAEVTATQIATTQETLYGQADSVRIFLLSSGDTIRLSKIHGLIQYPYQYGSDVYYQQVGVSGLERGFLPPDFFDCYDFEPGDRFEYRTRVSHAYGGTSTISQFSVIRRDNTYEGGIRYEVEGYTRVNHQDHGNRWTTYNKFEDFERQASQYDHLNYYNREGIIEPQLLTISAITTGFFNGEPEIITKAFNSHGSQPMLCDLPNDPDALCCYNCDYPPSGWQEYSHGKGIGLISESIYRDGYTIDKELVAVQKKNFRFGTFTSLGELTENGEAPSNTSSYPNPATKEVWVSLIPYDPGSTLVLSDSSGRVLAERSFSTGATLNIDLSQYAPGLYFYLIRDDVGKAIGHGKVVKAGL